MLCNCLKIFISHAHKVRTEGTPIGAKLSSLHSQNTDKSIIKHDMNGKCGDFVCEISLRKAKEVVPQVPRKMIEVVHNSLLSQKSN